MCNYSIAHWYWTGGKFNYTLRLLYEADLVINDSIGYYDASPPRTNVCQQMRNYTPQQFVTESQRIVRFVMRKTDDISSWTTEVVCNIHTGYQLPTIVTFNTLFVPYIATDVRIIKDRREEWKQLYCWWLSNVFCEKRSRFFAGSRSRGERYTETPQRSMHLSIEL